jgi:hypothetical protein
MAGWKWVASVSACLVLVVAPSAAQASSWSVTRLSDDEISGPLFAMSCPTTGLCLAGGSGNLIASSTNPTGGRAAWKVVHPGGAQEVPTGTPFGGPASAASTSPSEQIRGISCPSTGLCVAASFQGKLLVSQNPTGDVGAWNVTWLEPEKAPHVHLTGVSCPTTGLCVAVAYAGQIAYSTNPAGGSPAWTVVKLETPYDLRGISCASASLCVAVDNEGHLVSSTEPTGPASAWHLVGSPVGEQSLNGVSCPSPLLCVTGSAGEMISSTNPAGGLAGWRPVAAGTGLPVKGVSCPTTSACAAVDDNADVIVSTEPTGGPGAWSFKNVISVAEGAASEAFNGMFAISCPSTRLCAAAGSNEQIIVSANPFAPDPQPAATKRGKRPRVVIRRHPAKRIDPRKGGTPVLFGFHAIGRAKGFQCKLGGRYRTCKSPVHYRLGKGKHTFRVRAIGAGGLKGPAATFHFRIGAVTEQGPFGSCPPEQTGNSHPCIPHA